MVYNTIKAWGVATTNFYNVLVRSRRQGKAWGANELTPGMSWSAVEDRVRHGGADVLTPGMSWSAVEDRQGMGRRETNLCGTPFI